MSNPALVNVTFNGNSAGFNGGGIYNQGNYGGKSSPALTNVTFSGNSANFGGGMYNNGSSSGESNPTLTNVILWGNTADDDGVQVYNGDSATPTFSYSLVQNSGGSSGWSGTFAPACHVFAQFTPMSTMPASTVRPPSRRTR